MIYTIASGAFITLLQLVGDDKMDTKLVGKRIKEYRVKAGLTQEELSERVGISPNYLSAIERGVKLIRLDKLVCVINELNCSADDILIDVLKKSYEKKTSVLLDTISKLPEHEQKRVYEVLNALITTANI